MQFLDVVQTASPACFTNSLLALHPLLLAYCRLPHHAVHCPASVDSLYNVTARCYCTLYPGLPARCPLLLAVQLLLLAVQPHLLAEQPHLLAVQPHLLIE
jgi:hypothetical protein